MTSAENSRHDEEHGAGGDILNGSAREILQRGIEQLLVMTEGLDFRPLPSKRFPLPLTSAMLPGRPNAQAIRADVQLRVSDPVGVLGGVLGLLELYESNQPDVTEYFLEDMPFVRACFASKRCNGWISLLGGGDREDLECAVNERWQFRFFSGPRGRRACTFC